MGLRHAGFVTEQYFMVPSQSLSDYDLNILIWSEQEPGIFGF